MTAPSPLRLITTTAGLAAVLGGAAFNLDAASAPGLSLVATSPPACSGCDARHARLRGFRADPTQVQE